MVLPLVEKGFATSDKNPHTLLLRPTQQAPLPHTACSFTPNSLLLRFQTKRDEVTFYLKNA